jgi:hypothetical protein
LALTEQQLREQKLIQFKRAFQGMIATSKDAYKKTDSKYTRTHNRLYSSDDIRRIVQEGNPIERAALSEYFFITNGLYKRIILHYATFLTYSWIVVPYLKNRKYKISDKKIASTYYTATDFLTTF